MKIPAIRAKIGIWVYYIATLTFEQIAQHVKRVDDELHQSTLLREMLQRSITNNFTSIANYIYQQEERFFNSLVLAIYDGDPQWHEVRLDYGEGEEYYDLGLLELTGNEKIFPVDGQHRVEGIKKVVSEGDSFNSEKVPVIFIGHKKDSEGMQRARRLFSTLNRYAKPVSMRDIIALDEDDIIAIASRELIDNHPLFAEDRLFDSKTKAIPESNCKAFTSIITFYECNRELLWTILQGKEIKNSENKTVRGRAKIAQYIRFRPQDSEIKEFLDLCFEFWNAIINSLTPMKEYMDLPNVSSEPFRSKQGGYLLFRPVALLPFVKATVRIKEFLNCSYDETLKRMNKLPLFLDHVLWRNVLWNDSKNNMIMNNQNLVEKMLVYLTNKLILCDKDRDWMLQELKLLYLFQSPEEVENFLEQFVITD